jgi:hypothetical protein
MDNIIWTAGHIQHHVPWMEVIVGEDKSLSADWLYVRVAMSLTPGESRSEIYNS